MRLGGVGNETKEKKSPKNIQVSAVDERKQDDWKGLSKSAIRNRGGDVGLVPPGWEWQKKNKQDARVTVWTAENEGQLGSGILHSYKARPENWCVCVSGAGSNSPEHT